MFVVACRHRGVTVAIVTPAGQALLTGREVHDANIAVAPLEKETVTDSLSAAATLAYVDTRVAHVMSPVSGRVSTIAATLGAHVEKGAVLATLVSPDIGVASSDVGKAQAALIAAQHDYRRKQDLLAQHAAAPADVEQAEDAYQNAKAEYDRAHQKFWLLHGGGQQVTQDYALTSPIEGEVVARNVTPGVEVQGGYAGGTPVELFTVGDMRELWVFADVYEVDVARLKLGAAVTVRVLAFPDERLTSHIDWIASALDPATRTIRVRAVIENTHGLLKPDMFATMSIACAPKTALALPRDAVLRMGEQDVVFVALGSASDGRLKFERRPVSVDREQSPKWAVIEHGLEEGERVVVAGADSVSRAM
jgi:cobalt-zinc-cadmium efflux system membrane fusion protein